MLSFFAAPLNLRIDDSLETDMQGLPGDEALTVALTHDRNAFVYLRGMNPQLSVVIWILLILLGIPLPIHPTVHRVVDT